MTPSSTPAHPEAEHAAQPPGQHVASTTSPRAAVIAVVALCFGGMSASLMQTLVIPIQGELPVLLGTSAANASWVITATLLGGAVAMPIAGSLGDLFGKQRVLLGSTLVLLAGSVVAAVGDSLVPVLAGRTLQGLAMGFIPVGIALMREIVPPRMAATAVASMSATLGVGGAIGLPLSAWIAQTWDWHALFWVSAGLAAVMGLAVLVLVPHAHDARGGHLDVGGALLLALGLVAFLVGVSKGNDWGWTDPRTLAALALGLVVLLVWARFELRSDAPLVDLRTSAQRPVLLTNLAAVAIGFGMMAQAIVVPQLLELPEVTGYGLGRTVLEAGLWMAPGGLMMLVFAPVSSRLMNTIGARRTLMIGGTVLGLGYLVAVGLMAEPWQLLVASCIASAGVGIGYAAMPTLILQSVPPREAGAAVGLNGLSRSLGTTIASAVMAAVLTGSTQSLGGFAVPTESAFRICFVVGAAAALVGVLIAAGARPPREPASGRSAERSRSDEAAGASVGAEPATA